MACEADTSRKIIRDLTVLEKFFLGNVRYFDDLIVTHTDEEYMKKHYELDDKKNPMYFVKIDQKDPSKIEMSFNLTSYQPFAKKYSKSIYQTIFLNKYDS